MSFFGRTDDSAVNRVVAVVVGLLLGVFGILGLLAGSGHAATGPQGVKVLGQFEVNLASAVVHLVLAAALLVGAVAGRARLTNRVVGGICLLLAVYGLVAGTAAANLLAVHGHTSDLQLLPALVLVSAGVLADRVPGTGRGPKYRTVRY